MSDAQIAGATICVMSVLLVGTFFGPERWADAFEWGLNVALLVMLASIPVIGVLLLFVK